MSRIVAITAVPLSLVMGLRLISTGNSEPSRRRPSRSKPAPIERVRGAAE